MLPSKLVIYLKGRTSRLLQEEFIELRKKYLYQHMWLGEYFCRTIEIVAEEIIIEYLENQRDDIDEKFKINRKQL